MIEKIEQELLDSQSRVNSLRIELNRAENEIYKVERLLNILAKEKFSKENVLIIAYLTISCITPDFIKWALRPLTKKTKRIFRKLPNQPKVAGYQVRLASNSQKKLKILHAIANFMIGGSSRLVVDIVEKLGHIYHQEILTGFSPNPISYIGIPVYECRNPYEIISYLKKYKPDILHVHYWGDVDFGWYDKIFRAAEEIGCKVIENVNTPVVPYRSSMVQCYVYVSDYVLSNYGWPGEKNIVIHPGSDLDLFSPRSGHNTPEDCIGMVYRLESDKLNLQSIEVFIKVAKKRPTTKIIIVGDGSFLDSYKKTVVAQEVENSFEFTGAVPYVDLPNIYKKMSIFVAPVWKESFGQVTSFAMSMAIPVVGYKVGGLVEIVGDDGLLSPPGDSERLANIIVNLLDDIVLRQSIGEKNQKRVREMFSVEHMATQYKALYHSVIGESE